MSKKILLLRQILALLGVIIFCALMIRYAYVSSNCFSYESDDAWNTTVSKNFAFIGKYMVSQYSNGIFFETISTGVPVLLLQALFFKIFEINHHTTFIAVLIYGLLLYVLSVVFVGKKSKLYLLCCILFSLVLYRTGAFGYLLTRLYGELPAIFFSMAAFYFLYKIFEVNEKDEKKKTKICFIAGIFLGLALITKLIMVFLIVSILGLAIIDALIYKKFTVKSFFSIVVGILFIIFVEFLFRLVQFDFSFIDSIKSITDFLRNMYEQTKWGDIWRVKDSSTISQRIEKIPMMINFNFFPVIYVSLPVFIYLLSLIFKRKENLLMIYVGVCASSIFIYYIFFGTLALHNKRMFPYTYFLLCYYIYGVLLIVKYVFSIQKLKLIFKIPILIVFLLFCIGLYSKYHLTNFVSICDTPFLEKDSMRYREDEYIKILKQIPIDSKIFTISTNTPVLYLYTNISKSYSIKKKELDYIIDSISEDEKVYMVCDLLDDQLESDKNNIDILKQNGIDLNKINEIECEEPYDFYGIYEFRIRDKQAFKNWHKNYLKSSKKGKS